MDDKRFWDVIAFCCGPEAGQDEWYDVLVEQLVKLDPEDLVAFDHHFDELTDCAYTIDLRAAASLISGGGMSDEGFYYFRCWLVGMGKMVYENALANPDSLAEVMALDPQNEAEAEIHSVARTAWRRKGLPEEEFNRMYNALGPWQHRELQGEDWDFDDDDEVERRFPRLVALYP